MKRDIIASPQAPQAIGPYSQAIRSGDFVFTSGTLGMDPASGNLLDGLDAQVRQAFNNLREILTEAGASLETVVKTTVFLKNMSDFAGMNAIYGEYFQQQPPARSTVEVAALPKGALFEIEAIAILKK